MAATLRNSVKPYHLKLFFSNLNTHAQIVRAADGHIMASASTVERVASERLSVRSDKAAATLIGELLAQRAKAAAIDSVSWQRKKGQRFHGKVEALLTAMQSAGLPLK